MGVGVGGAAGAGAAPAARWRALYARRPLRPIADQAQAQENIYESVNAGAGAMGAGAGAYWWWRGAGGGGAAGGTGGAGGGTGAGRGCRHARASQTLEFNERAPPPAAANTYQGTMPRAHRGGRAGASPEAEAAAYGAGVGRGCAGAGAGAGGAGGARLSASCGTIHVELPPCVVLVPRCLQPRAPPRPAPPPPAHPAHPAHAHPRPSCSYHLLPESHRVLPFVCHQSTSRECCSDSESDMRDSEEGVPSDDESDFASAPPSRAASPPAPSVPDAPVAPDAPEPE